MARGSRNAILSKIYSKRKKILDMMYTPSELADDLGLDRRYVHDSLIKQTGIIFSRESNNRVYISGASVIRWIETLFDERKNTKKEKRQLADNEFYCMKCHCRRTVLESVFYQNGKKLEKIAYCPDCGTRMRKYVKGD